MTFNELKKNLKKDFTGLKRVKLALLGDSATQFLSLALRAWGYEKGLDADVYEADYNLIYETLMDGNNKLYRGEYEYIIIFQSAEKAADEFYHLPREERPLFAQKRASYMRVLADTVAANNPQAKIIFFNYPEIDDGVFGSFSAKTSYSLLHQIRKLNVLVQDLAQEKGSVFVLDVLSLVNRVGTSNAVSSKWYIVSQNVFQIDFLPAVAKACIDIISAFAGRSNKCIILDLDNTIWGGVIGDDGMDRIQLGDLGIGKAFTQLQVWVKELKQRGVIVAVCSKNDERVAKEVFEKHPDMVLRLEDISLFVANWSNKGDNLKYIQEVLNIGLDSMVFIDDNPFERNLVRSMFPAITVPELPEDPASYLTYLQSLNLFETVSFTDEDLQRTRQYQEESQRAVIRNSSESLEKYLAGLEMEAVVETITPFNLARCAQLTQRSNQFNLTTIRYSEEQLTQFLNDGGKAVCISLKDRFGDYGLISLLLLEKKNDVMEINTWIMSCRVLKRGVEEFAVNEVMKVAAAEGAAAVEGAYVSTAKNSMVKDIYGSMGFEKLGDGKSRREVRCFQPFTTFIRRYDSRRN
jgi:FkbH-like protein